MSPPTSPTSPTSPIAPTSRRARRWVPGVVVALGAAVVGFIILRRPMAYVPPPGVEAARADGAVRDVDALVEDGHRYAPRVWSFGLDRFELRIEDVGPERALDAALVATHAELVVNGGFFDAKNEPVGLAMSGGRVLSPLDPSLSGGVVVSNGSRAELHASEGFSTPAGAELAIQCRPRLVVDGAPNVKRDDRQRAERTALCLRDGGRRVDVVIVRPSDDGRSDGPSLFAFASWLASAGCEGALNLDGGPSTGVAWRENGKVETLAPRGPVRHVVAFARR